MFEDGCLSTSPQTKFAFALRPRSRPPVDLMLKRMSDESTLRTVSRGDVHLRLAKDVDGNGLLRVARTESILLRVRQLRSVSDEGEGVRTYRNPSASLRCKS